MGSLELFPLIYIFRGTDTCHWNLIGLSSHGTMFGIFFFFFEFTLAATIVSRGLKGWLDVEITKSSIAHTRCRRIVCVWANFLFLWKLETSFDASPCHIYFNIEKHNSKVFAWSPLSRILTSQPYISWEKQCFIFSWLAKIILMFLVN